MNDFQQLVEGLSDGRVIYFDSLDFDTQCALVGQYLLENHEGADEIEPLVESLMLGIGEPSGTPTVLYSHMADGEPPRDTLASWGLVVVRSLVRNYSGLVQSAVDEILERAGPDDDTVYEMERDRRMGL